MSDTYDVIVIGRGAVVCATGWVFKLVPLVGRICADLVCEGVTSYDISPFRISADTLG